MFTIAPETLSVIKQMVQKIQQGWCQHHLALNKHKESTHPASKEACKWCILGSFDAVAEGDERVIYQISQQVMRAIKEGIKRVHPNIEAEPAMSDVPIGRYNDSYCTTQSDALHVLQEALNWIGEQQGETNAQVDELEK